MKRLFVCVVVLLSAVQLHAQKASLSVNLLDCAALGTLNADVSYAVSRRLSVTAGVKYNPFTFRSGDREHQFQMRQRSCALGVRLWPWHTLSGWWFASRLRCQEYNFGGIFSREAQEGDRVGAGVYAGYTHMLSRHFNIEFGMGLWAGADFYRRYSCGVCGTLVGAGTKAFVLPDDLAVSIVYVF